ncbi:MAG TPA: LCP family protein [Candidatus Limnocylindria bacterium]|nr:LCP family protein [Candidatus Limnocylindria bacterium]
MRAQATPDQPVPYDRELIRSGGVSSSERRQARPSGDGGRRPPRQPRRRRGGFGRVLGTVLVGLLLVVVVVGVVLFGRVAAFNASVSTAPFPSTALFGALNGSDRVNVLLVGYGGADHDGAYLADSIQVLSIDPTTDTTTTIPIPRDLWIEGVGAYPRNGKVNEVFSTGHANGGLEEAGALLADVLSDVTGLRIEHWLSIDFAGFRDMIDAVGGVTIENPTEFSYTNNETDYANRNFNLGTFPAGELRLDGAQALAYARARYTDVPSESNDFARSVRQARILGALRDELGDGGIGSIVPGLRLMDAMEGRVRTDLSAIDLALLASHLHSDRRIELSEDVVLRATTNTVGQYILIPVDWTGPGDYAVIRSYLADELSAAP